MTATAQTRPELAHKLGAAPSITGNQAVDDYTEAQIDDGAKGMIMRMLSDAYSNSEEAVVRELVTNAIDAQLVLGVSEPVRLALPEEGFGKLVVADAGIGMSAEQVSTNFCNFGQSLKTFDALVTGQYGIGAKSIYAVASQFTVTTTYEGLTTTAHFLINERGVPAHRILSSQWTGRPCGTTITIPVPVSSASNWHQAAAKALLHLRPGTVAATRGPEAPIRFTSIFDLAVPEMSTDTVLVFNSTDSHQAAPVIMNNIGYAVPSHLDEMFVAGKNNHYRYGRRVKKLVVLAEPASLELTHTREQIKDTPDNAALLKSHIDSWYASVFGETCTGWNDMPSQLAQLAAYRRIDHDQQHLFPHEPPNQYGIVHALRYIYDPSKNRVFPRENIDVSMETLHAHLIGPDRHVLVDIGPVEAWAEDHDVEGLGNPRPATIGSARAAKLTKAVRGFYADWIRTHPEQAPQDLPTVHAMSRKNLMDRSAADPDKPLLSDDDLAWAGLDDFIEAHLPAQGPKKRRTPTERSYPIAFVTKVDLEHRQQRLDDKAPDGQQAEPVNPADLKPHWDSLRRVPEMPRRQDLAQASVEQIRQAVQATDRKALVLCTTRNANLSTENPLLHGLSNDTLGARFIELLEDAVFLSIGSQKPDGLAELVGARVVVGFDEHLEDCAARAVRTRTKAVVEALARSVHRHSWYPQPNDHGEYPALQAAVRMRPAKKALFLTDRSVASIRFVSKALDLARMSKQDLPEPDMRNRLAEQYPLLNELANMSKYTRVSDGLVELVLKKDESNARAARRAARAAQ